MSLGLDTALQIYASVVTSLLLIGLAAFAWYFRTHVLGRISNVEDEVEKNTEFRQYVAGTDYDDDHGELHSIEADMKGIARKMGEQHDEVMTRVTYAVEYCRRIAQAVDADIPEPDRKWTTTHDNDDD